MKKEDADKIREILEQVGQYAPLGSPADISMKVGGLIKAMLIIVDSLDEGMNRQDK